jgi:hypothetical protein
MEQSGIRSRVCVVGHEMFRIGMQTERSGNISTLIDQNRLLITRRGSSLRMLHPVTDLVEVNGVGDIPAEASSETRVHLSRYGSQSDRTRAPALRDSDQFQARLVYPCAQRRARLIGECSDSAFNKCGGGRRRGNSDSLRTAH